MGIPLVSVATCFLYVSGKAVYTGIHYHPLASVICRKSIILYANVFGLFCCKSMAVNVWLHYETGRFLCDLHLIIVLNDLLLNLILMSKCVG